MKTYVTKPFLPPYEEYCQFLKQVWDKNILTNQGPLLQELESKLKCFMDVENLHLLSNGTLALQLALKALDITDGEIITTPFSYVATTSSILWERCQPVFVDVEPDNFTIDVNKIESAITSKTRAIMAVHVFGYACDVEKIQKIADKYNLKVVYDGAHAFGCKYKKKSLLDYGDISTLSFHATKLFHTIEGGACIVKDKNISDKMALLYRFGQCGDDQLILGINAKNSEFHAAMGLANFKYIADIISARKKVSELYDTFLNGILKRPKFQKNLEYNYAYYPVVFENETELLNVFKVLNENDIFPRRYFWPSLNNLSYLKTSQKCPISENICSRIACLPLYFGLSNEKIQKITNIIKEVV